MMGKKQLKARKLLDELYKNPIIDSQRVTKVLSITPSTANSLLKEFENQSILFELTGFKRNRLYLFKDYMQIFRDY